MPITENNLCRLTSKRNRRRGFSLIELMIVVAILGIVLGSVVRYIGVATQRSKVEQTKVDLTQEAREFVDEFERDIHQAGYPNCRMFNTASNCVAQYNNPQIAAGLVSVDSSRVVFEGDIDGDGIVDSVWYRLVDSAGNSPPANCPCTIQRGVTNPAVGKVAAAPLAQTPIWSQELQNVVNSGRPVAPAVYGGGAPISGNVLFGGGAMTNDAYYAAVSTFKDFPVFSAYDQNGQPVGPLPVDITTPAGRIALASIKTVRLTINLLGSATGGYDSKTMTRPVMTLVGTGRINNCTPVPGGVC
jgi:prepilin-type N-terminal cleavage/methylation domain-containing protein